MCLVLQSSLILSSFFVATFSELQTSNRYDFSSAWSSPAISIALKLYFWENPISEFIQRTKTHVAMIWFTSWTFFKFGFVNFTRFPTCNILINYFSEQLSVSLCVKSFTAVLSKNIVWTFRRCQISVYKVYIYRKSCE